MNSMKHSIMIPDDIWEWWQNRTGQSKPARAIRDEIIKLTAILKTQEHHEVEQAVEDYILNDTVDFAVPDDAPTPIIIERTGVCMFCLRVMRKGEEAFWFTSHDRKHVAHPECWEENRQKASNGT